MEGGVMKILLNIGLLLWTVSLFAVGENEYTYHKGKTWLEVEAFPMRQPLVIPQGDTAGILTAEWVPEGQNTLVFCLNLPQYCEGLFFSRDYRPGDYSWPHNTNRLLPWGFRCLSELNDTAYPGIPSNGKVLVQGDALLLHLQDGTCLFLKTLAGENSISWMKVTPEGSLQLYVSTLGKDVLEGKLPLLLRACGTRIYPLMQRAFQKLAENTSVSDVKRREQKVLPEPFYYLGWCSWEHYHKNIDEKQLLKDIREIEHSGLPVRYVLIDDGHVQHRKNRLSSFRPDSVKFLRGWQAILDTRRKDKIRWMGLWFALPGYWEGISPENDFPEEIRECLYEQHGSWLPGNGWKNIETYYRYYLETLSSYGFDFLKIDVQSLQLPLYMGGTEVIRQARGCNRALENETHRLQLGLINCMAHNVINMDNTRYSAVTRVSIDYQKFNEDMARSHLFQSYVNTLWMGQSVWPDHDMFHSCDSICGAMMARSKALSGGPVYLSDAPVDFVPDLIWPLVNSEGRLFRPLMPAVPAPESVFSNPFRSGKAWRVVAPVGDKAMAVICYNLNKDTGKVAAILRPEDYLCRTDLMKEEARLPERILLYDWQNRSAEELKDEKTVVLEGLNDRLFYFCPIVNGWSVIGLQEKYLSPATVEIIACTPEQLVVNVLDKGILNIWNDGKLREIEVTQPGKMIFNKTSL